MTSLQKAGGIASIMEALIYVSAFIFYGALIEFPNNGSPTEKLVFLSENHSALSITNLIFYVGFGILLAILVLSIHERLKHKAPVLSQLASVFGFIWVALIIASGMIANIGLAAVIDLSASEPGQAMTVSYAINIIVEGLGGGNEVVGGLWVLILSVAALKIGGLSKALCYLGILVGGAGVSTVYPAEILTVTFGVSQIIWFAWLGVYLLMNRAEPIG